MSFFIHSADHFVSGPPGYFDHDLINVPEAQEETAYAYHISLEEKLGLVNPYGTWLSKLSENSEIPLEDHAEDSDAENRREREATPDSATGSATGSATSSVVTLMDTLDNGSGRVRGSPLLYEKLRSVRRDHSKSDCSVTSPPSTPPPMRAPYHNTPPDTPMMMYESSSTSSPEPEGKQHADGLDWPWYQCVMDGMQPTEAFIECASSCTSPVPQDPFVWEMNRLDRDMRMSRQDHVISWINRESLPQSPTRQKRRGGRKKSIIASEKQQSVKHAHATYNLRGSRKNPRQ